MKLLAASLLPNLALWAVLIVGLVLVLTRGRRWLALPILALGFLSLPIGPKLAASIWVLEERMPERVEGLAVLVPGGGITGPDALGRYWPRSAGVSRSMVGSALARANGLPLILSGGRTVTDGPSEARVMAGFLGTGIDPILEESARNTCETAEALPALLTRHGLRGVILVTDGVHLRRTRACLRAYGIETAGLVPTDKDNRTVRVFDFVPMVVGLARWGTVGYEVTGAGYYVLRGWIGPGDLLASD